MGHVRKCPFAQAMHLMTLVVHHPSQVFSAAFTMDAHFANMVCCSMCSLPLATGYVSMF